MPFETNVFINCPFDSKYYPLLRPVIFTVLYLGFEPRIALERLDGGETRFQNIVELIESSKFGIHDLSRLKAEKKGEFFRLNMPFELGVDVGCRLFKGGNLGDKKILILETEKYRVQKALSDLSNSDIASHDDDPPKIVEAVRNWLNTEAKLSAKGASFIWGRFSDFMGDNFDALKSRDYSAKEIENLPIPELIADIKAWLQVQKI